MPTIAPAPVTDPDIAALQRQVADLTAQRDAALAGLQHVFAAGRASRGLRLAASEGSRLILAASS